MNSYCKYLHLILTAIPLIVAGLLSGCNPGCQTTSSTTTTGATPVSTCGSGTTSSNTGSGYSLSGGVSGGTLQGVLINLSGAVIANTTTDVSGNYSFTGLANGNYKVIPSLGGNTFRPASSVVTIGGGNVVGTNFSETVYQLAISSISGTASGAVAPNVMITLSGANIGSTLTDTSGNFTFTGLAAGIYTVTPTLPGYVFSPVSIAVTTSSGSNATGNNFLATANTVATAGLSGAVSGAVAQNVTITLSGANSGSVVTDANGNFSFAGLLPGIYTITPSLAGFIFSPASNTVTTTGGANVIVSNFTSAP